MGCGRRAGPRPGSARRYGARRNGVLCVVLAAAFAACAAGAAAENPADIDGLASPDGQYLDWMDSAVPPRLDFFRYANGGGVHTPSITPSPPHWGGANLFGDKDTPTPPGML